MMFRRKQSKLSAAQKKSYVLAGAFAILFLLSSGLSAVEDTECLECHDTIHAKKFKKSVHAEAGCVSCHDDITEIPHTEKPAKVDCSSCHDTEAADFKNSDHGAHSKGALTRNCTACHGAVHEILPSSDPHSKTNRLNIPATCGACHDGHKNIPRAKLSEPWPLLTYNQTVHAKELAMGNSKAAVCTDCHGVHAIDSAASSKSLIHRSRIPETCGQCHKMELAAYNQSIHAKALAAGKKEAPVCTDCHGEHTILSPKDPTSSVHAAAVSEKTCGHCHEAAQITAKYRLPSDRLKSYKESYHGLSNQYGNTTVANCASCHEAHRILPSTDPESSVHKSNLPKTCGHCHANAGDQWAQGSVHLSPSPGRDQAIYFVMLFYVGLIVLVIGGMVIHNFLDFSAKLRAHYRKLRQEGEGLHFTRNERIQHAVLFISFTMLAYSGFALKYHDAWWAMPFTFYAKSFDWRGWIHRGAAVVFSGLSLYHAFYLALTRRGREQFKAFLPVKKDFQDIAAMFRYYIGKSPQRPKFERYSYIEKAEYWALMWGSMIMIITGLLLSFVSQALKFLPKWALDVATTIHFYEAVLATLAIFVWHFYFVIFDPEEYPVNLSMTTGHRKRSHEEKSKPAPPKGSQDSSQEPGSPPDKNSE